MAGRQGRTRRSAISAALAVGALLAVTTSVGATHLEEACTAFVSTEGREPGSSASVAVGDQVEVHGWFPTGGEAAPPVFVSLEKNGVQQELFPDVERDENDEILLVITFEPGDEGEWLITAGGENTDCGGQANVTVVAAAAATPTPAPTPLPDTAAPPTTVDSRPLLVLVVAAISLLAAGATLMSRRARD